jgi:hypothetical protein
MLGRVLDQAALSAPAVTTVGELAERLAAIQQALSPEDGLAYFNRMYQLVTDAVDQNLGATAFIDPGWMTCLDLTFGNLYLDAVRASVANPEAVPRAWAALLERRGDMSLAPLQFALAGMNAHINRDLPVAIVFTCSQLQTTPEAGSHHQDFFHVNAVLAQVEPTIRQTVEGMLLEDADRVVPGLQDLAVNFNMVKARETAWINAETLWILRELSPAREAAYLDGLDHLAGFAGRGLLVSLRR